MKKEFRKHVQKYCDISNWSRMHNVLGLETE